METDIKPNETMELAMARYNGVAVWSSVAQPRTQVRTLSQSEKVTLLEEAGDGWLHARLADGGEGFVRRDALRPYIEGMAQPRPSAPSPAFAPGAGHVGTSSNGDHAYSGARWAAIGLMGFAWIAFVGGQLAGLGAAASFDCNSYSNSCNDEAASRFMLYFTFAGTSFVAALFAWGISYAVFLADRIEMRVRGTGTA